MPAVIPIICVVKARSQSRQLQKKGGYIAERYGLEEVTKFEAKERKEKRRRRHHLWNAPSFLNHLVRVFILKEMKKKEQKKVPVLEGWFQLFSI